MSELEHWEERYRSGEMPWDTGKPSAELERVVEERKFAPCKAIELGCGTGTNAVWLASLGFDMTAVDLSPLALDLGRGKAATAGVRVRWIAADLLDPPDLGGPFEFFFDRGCYHVVRRVGVEGYLKTLDRITAPGTVGLVLAGNAKEKQEPGPPVVTEDELRSELGRLFDIVSLTEIRFDQPNWQGPKPLGWSCLLRRPQ